MKKVKIVRGTFGMNTGTQVVPITAQDPPVDVEDKLAERLVAKGVAEYVNSSAAKQDGALPSADPLAYDDATTLKQLQAIAVLLGVDASKMRAKKQVIDAIEAAKDEKAAQEAGDNDDGQQDNDDGNGQDDGGGQGDNGGGEAPPNLGAADPV